MSAWNYRVVKHVTELPGYGEETWYSVHEHHFNVEDEEDELFPEIGSITINRMAPSGESVDELKRELERMLKACDKEVLNFDDF